MKVPESKTIKRQLVYKLRLDGESVPVMASTPKELQRYHSAYKNGT